MKTQEPEERTLQGGRVKETGKTSSRDSMHSAHICLEGGGEEGGSWGWEGKRKAGAAGEEGK